jgi:hypothetical protein
MNPLDPTLPPNAELLDLVYQEFLARRRAGQSPLTDEYVARLPEHQHAITTK